MEDSMYAFVCQEDQQSEELRRRTKDSLAQGNRTLNQSIKILKARHEYKRSHTPAQPHGQQTPRRKATQAWGAKSESRKR